MPTKKKKQPKDTVLIAREVVEAAIGGPLTPKKSNKKKPVGKAKR